MDVLEHLSRITAAGAVLSVAGGLLALLLSVVVLRAPAPRSINRGLAAVLAIQGLLSFSLAGLSVFTNAARGVIFLPTSALLIATSIAMLALIGLLETPLAKPFRRRGPLLALGAVLIALALGQELLVLRERPLAEGDDGIAWITLGLASAYALIASLDGLRRTARGSVANRQSRAFVLAFGTRDVASVAGVGLWVWGHFRGPLVLKTWTEVVSPVAVIVFVVLLAYGILRMQLFDIDLKLKAGISRGTVASLALAVVFVISKVVEAKMSRDYGYLAGAIAAGLLLFGAPRLNKLGDKVANTAMPKVQPTSEYLAFKKCEVYRAAAESAIEGDGTIDAKERQLLDRLRAKLGLSDADAAAIEAEAMPPQASAPTAGSSA